MTPRKAHLLLALILLPPLGSIAAGQNAAQPGAENVAQRENAAQNAGPRPAPGDTRIADAAMKRDTAAVRALVEQKVDVNAPGKDGTPALHWLVRVDDLDSARLLLRAGADAKRANRYRRHAALSRVRQRQRRDDPAAARRRSGCERAGSDGRNAVDDGVEGRQPRLGEAAARSRCRGRYPGSGVSTNRADGGGPGKPSGCRPAVGGASTPTSTRKREPAGRRHGSCRIQFPASDTGSASFAAGFPNAGRAI